jgi:NAD(P)-dependent dehydrogenase (short-subunit alcohol dehydrogenase family)
VINFDDLQSQEKYSASGAYGQSKLACLMFAYELQRRLEKLDTNTISVAAHPGISPTNLAQHLPKIVLLLMPILAPFFTHSPKKGAEPTLYGALGTDAKGGDYFGPGNKREFRGPAAKVDSTPLSKDEEVAKRLWEVSEKLTDLQYLS